MGCVASTDGHGPSPKARPERNVHVRNDVLQSPSHESRNHRPQLYENPINEVVYSSYQEEDYRKDHPSEDHDHHDNETQASVIRRNDSSFEEEEEEEEDDGEGEEKDKLYESVLVLQEELAKKDEALKYQNEANDALKEQVSAYEKRVSGIEAEMSQLRMNITMISQDSRQTGNTSVLSQDQVMMDLQKEQKRMEEEHKKDPLEPFDRSYDVKNSIAVVAQFCYFTEMMSSHTNLLKEVNFNQPGGGGGTRLGSRSKISSTSSTKYRQHIQHQQQQHRVERIASFCGLDNNSLSPLSNKPPPIFDKGHRRRLHGRGGKENAGSAQIDPVLQSIIPPTDIIDDDEPLEPFNHSYEEIMASNANLDAMLSSAKKKNNNYNYNSNVLTPSTQGPMVDVGHSSSSSNKFSSDYTAEHGDDLHNRRKKLVSKLPSHPSSPYNLRGIPEEAADPQRGRDTMDDLSDICEPDPLLYHPQLERPRVAGQKPISHPPQFEFGGCRETPRLTSSARDEHCHSPPAVAKQQRLGTVPQGGGVSAQQQQQQEQQQQQQQKNNIYQRNSQSIGLILAQSETPPDKKNRVFDEKMKNIYVDRREWVFQRKVFAELSFSIF
eukprot:jgi/Bigna1/75807/fgenesh1_pg.37_\